MKALWLVPLILSVSTAMAGPSRIYFFDGFVVPIPITSEIRAHGHIETFLGQKFPDTKLHVTHYVFNQTVCEEIKALAPADRPDKLILIGHSFGVGGTHETSRCLKEIPVDLIVSIDGAPETEANVLIPDNVREYVNYYQTLDLIVRGVQKNRRPGEDQTGVRNIFIDVPLSISPHIQIVDELFERDLILSLLEKTLEAPVVASEPVQGKELELDDL